jgi:putative NIF3 family GTP cyclohydrolase 1 type 2
MSIPPTPFNGPSGRRKFIADTLKITGGLTLLASPAISMAGEIFSVNKKFTVQEVMDIILKEIPGAPFKQTVDTLKSGTADQKVSGIVTTMFPTVDVIKKAMALNANFIIAHEPSFYNHADDINWVTDNSVVKQKQELLQKNKIAIWRFHDYWHTHRPDGVSYGVLKKAGWLQYYKADEPIVAIPPVSLKQITEHLKSSLGIDHVRIIGDLSQQCGRIGLMPGAAAGQSHVSFIEKEKPDVLVVGELREWETAEYVRDAQSMGSKTALIVLGHSVSEEPGMEYLVEWLQPKLSGLKITHVPSKNPFTWV